MDENSILLSFFLLAGIILLLLTTFSFFMRKWFKVDKGIFFENRHVNNKHKIIDMILQGITIAALVIIFSIIIVDVPVGGQWELLIGFIIVIYIIAHYVLKGFMEWKHDDNPNTYKVTILESLFIVVLLVVLIWTDFFGLFY